MKALVRLNPTRTTTNIYIIVIALFISLNPLKGSTPSDFEEGDISLESWMTAPFETTYADEDLSLEPWMTAPFETNYADEDLSLEPWMTAPFETNYVEFGLAVESWMTAAF